MSSRKIAHDAREIVPLYAAALAGVAASHGGLTPKEIASKAAMIARAGLEEMGKLLEEADPSSER